MHSGLPDYKADDCHHCIAFPHYLHSKDIPHSHISNFTHVDFSSLGVLPFFSSCLPFCSYWLTSLASPQNGLGDSFLGHHSIPCIPLPTLMVSYWSCVSLPRWWTPWGRILAPGRDLVGVRFIAPSQAPWSNIFQKNSCSDITLAQPKVREVELEDLKQLQMPAIHIEMEISVHLTISKTVGLRMNFSQTENLQSHSPQSLIHGSKTNCKKITKFLLFFLSSIDTFPWKHTLEDAGNEGFKEQNESHWPYLRQWLPQRPLSQRPLSSSWEEKMPYSMGPSIPLQASLMGWDSNEKKLPSREENL